MISYLTLALFGCILGIFTGLVPGIHVNTVCLIGLSMFPLFNIGPVEFAIVMMSMGITHTFLDFIPAIFIGVPNEDTAMSILPAHKLVLEGKSFLAVKITGFGSFLGLLFSILLIGPVLIILPIVYERFRFLIFYIIIIMSFYLIIREVGLSKKGVSLIIFILSGTLGLIVLNLKAISSTQVLFPVFAGLFGLSNIVHSINSSQRYVPQEPFAVLKVDRRMIVNGFYGTVGGALVGILPAMSPAQIAILLSGLIGSDTISFIIAVSAINTSDCIFSLVSLYSMGNPRSGVTVMLSRLFELSWYDFMLLIAVTCFIAPIVLIVHLKIGGYMIGFISRINYKLISIISAIFVWIVIYWLTGFLGVFISVVSMVIGLLPILSGVGRTHLMGVLIIPTLSFFLSYS